MTELPYSFHIGSNKNRKTSSRSRAKNNLSKSTSLANNGIQNYQQLSKVNKHDFRKYDNYNELVYQLKGSNDVVRDVKNFYKNEFEEARIEYNNKQIRPSRKINDYFEYVSNDEKRDLACEIIIELGNKEYWDSKDFEFKKKMINVYKENLHDLENIVPEFKITNAVVHLDETSPHMHIVGVPIKENCKTGLRKQVNKSFVFTKSRLENIQEMMRKRCIDSFNKYFEEKATLKQKLKGRNKDIHVKDMYNYEELKKELEVNKKSIDESNKNIESIKDYSNGLKEILSNLGESRFGGYKLNNNQKERLENLVKEVESLSNYFDNYKNMINNLSLVNDNLEYQKDTNTKLILENNKLLKANQKMQLENVKLKKNIELLNNDLDKKESDRIDFITYLCKNVNNEYSVNNDAFKDVVDDMYDKKYISRKERFVIFNPPRLINKSEVERALNHINQEMEKESEKYWKYKVYGNDDYTV